MAAAAFDQALDRVLNSLERPFILKQEQRLALEAFVNKKKDVLALLPTGFGKSLIYQLAPLVAKEIGSIKTPVVVVVSPLIALIEDQIKEAADLGISATQLVLSSIYFKVALFKVLPNRPNIRLAVRRLVTDSLDCFDWLVKNLKERRLDMLPVIIYCRTINTVTRVFLHLNHTLPVNKSRVLSSINGEGNCRVAVATTALGVGLNFPKVSHVIMYGLPEDPEAILQQVGRAGRDGSPAHAVLYANKQVANTDNAAKTVLQESLNGCFRKALYSHFEEEVSSINANSCCFLTAFLWDVVIDNFERRLKTDFFAPPYWRTVLIQYDNAASCGFLPLIAMAAAVQLAKSLLFVTQLKNESRKGASRWRSSLKHLKENDLRSAGLDFHRMKSYLREHSTSHSFLINLMTSSLISSCR
uniref:DNA 3'-5' helicase n=1 Tax=Acanthochromis polyacanthus TaxID=80966 RepID=A0A3Q1ERV5_9TELE